MPPSVRRARGEEREWRAAAGSFINPAANSFGNGRIHSSSESYAYGSAIAATIESIRTNRGSAFSRCWPSRRLDKHGYIDMGTDTTFAGPAVWSLAPQDERCFLPPLPPAPLPAPLRRTHFFTHHRTGTRATAAGRCFIGVFSDDNMHLLETVPRDV